jgi:hypothetical protein
MRQKRPAKIVPEIECQAHDIAQGTIERGFVAIKNVAASDVAKPAFCIPISIERVRLFAMLNFAMWATMYPRM